MILLAGLRRQIKRIIIIGWENYGKNDINVY